MKPTILLIGDDIRFPSGVSNVCKDIILNTLHKFNWVQLASRKNHPEKGKIIDASKSIAEQYKIDDCYLRLYCCENYGDESTLLNVCESEKIDAILHMTDPRFYTWLYAIENKIRKKIPICYYHVWDNYPIPHFNKGVYHSCDWIGCISKLTHDVVSKVTDGNVPCDYVPHGVDTNLFKKQDDVSTEVLRKNLLQDTCEFAFLCNNVNMRRKQLPTVLEAFDKVSNTLPKNEAKHIMLMLHTNQVGEGGLDLINVCDELYPDLNVLFSTTKLAPDVLSQMYNTFNCTINIASNEGFGLSTLESLATETPIICSRTGGLNDQIDDNNTWGIGIEPDARRLVGDKSTQYLYEDIVSSDSLAEAMIAMHSKTTDELNTMGKLGRDNVIENFTLEQMTEKISDGIQGAIENHKPSPKYRFTNIK